MGGVHQGIRGGLTPDDDFRGASGGKAPPCRETFQYLNTLAFASNHSFGRVYILSSFA